MGSGDMSDAAGPDVIRSSAENAKHETSSSFCKVSHTNRSTAFDLLRPWNLRQTHVAIRMQDVPSSHPFSSYHHRLTPYFSQFLTYFLSVWLKLSTSIRLFRCRNSIPDPVLPSLAAVSDSYPCQIRFPHISMGCRRIHFVVRRLERADLAGSGDV